MKRRHGFLFLLLVLIIVMRPLRVWAQSDPNPSSVNNNSTITESAGKGEDIQIDESRPVESDELTAATKLYFDNVALYRDAQDKYEIAREQYYKLNTLASQDEAIRRGKDVLRARAEVLQSYFRYLELVLLRTKGIEIAQKEQTLAQLRQWQVNFGTHRESVAAMDTRPQIHTHMTTLNTQSPTIYGVAYSALILIKMGQIQTAVDNAANTRIVLGHLIETSNSISAADKTIKTRGLEEVDRQIESSRQNLQKMRQDFTRDSQSLLFNELAYRRYQEVAESSYLQLRQASEFMNEIAKGMTSQI